jgi:hypothetical protein
MNPRDIFTRVAGAHEAVDQIGAVAVVEARVGETFVDLHLAVLALISRQAIAIVST